MLNWGDARIGNMLYRDFEPAAVLDWEMATVGPREVDVAWMIFLDTFFDDLAERFEMPALAGFMDRDDIVREYERLTGHTVRRWNGSRCSPRCGSRSCRCARAPAASPTARWNSPPIPTTSSCSAACSNACSTADQRFGLRAEPNGRRRPRRATN